MLIAGLGNPGREYERTRHNIGWLVVDELARRSATSFKAKFNGKLAETRLAGERVILLEPETYMNESGRSIGPALAFYKLEPTDLLVVHDDIDLEEGKLQARMGGGLAGHNGLKSISKTIGTNDFLRLRIGVGRPGPGDRRSVADFVLSGFDPHVDLDALVGRGADVVETLVRDGLDEAIRHTWSA
jgi:PTH1 family peptidyl-tRNA hydrolase